MGFKSCCASRQHNSRCRCILPRANFQPQFDLAKLLFESVTDPRSTTVKIGNARAVAASLCTCMHGTSWIRTLRAPLQRLMQAAKAIGILWLGSIAAFYLRNAFKVRPSGLLQHKGASRLRFINCASSAWDKHCCESSPPSTGNICCT